MWAKYVEAPPPTSAYTTAHCKSTPGRPYYSDYRKQCVDVNGHSGWSPLPAQPLSPKLPPLRDIRETADAARICQPWAAPWGNILQSPIIPPDGAKPAGRAVCDKYWGMNTASYPDVALMDPDSENMHDMRTKHQFGEMREALRQAAAGRHSPAWVFWIMLLSLIIVAAVLMQ